MRENGAEAASGDLDERRGPRGDRSLLRALLRRRAARAAEGPAKPPGHSFSDVARKVVSIINLASVGSARRRWSARPVDPLRFRGNLYVRGWPAWSELDLVGRDIAIGGTARAKVVKRIVRCAATNVEPGTGIRDLNIPQTLMQRLGHADCGVYAEITAAGDVAPGDRSRCSAQG